MDCWMKSIAWRLSTPPANWPTTKTNRKPQRRLPTDRPKHRSFIRKAPASSFWRQRRFLFTACGSGLILLESKRGTVCGDDVDTLRAPLRASVKAIVAQSDARISNNREDTAVQPSEWLDTGKKISELSSQFKQLSAVLIPLGERGDGGRAGGQTRAGEKAGTGGRAGGRRWRAAAGPRRADAAEAGWPARPGPGGHGGPRRRAGGRAGRARAGAAGGGCGGFAAVRPNARLA